MSQRYSLRNRKTLFKNKVFSSIKGSCLNPEAFRESEKEMVFIEGEKMNYSKRQRNDSGRDDDAFVI